MDVRVLPQHLGPAAAVHGLCAGVLWRKPLQALLSAVSTETVSTLSETKVDLTPLVKGARCSSVVRAFADGAMGRQS